MSQRKSLHDPIRRSMQVNKNAHCQQIRLMNKKSRTAHRLRLRKCQNKRLLLPIENLIHRKRLIKSQKKRLMDNKRRIYHNIILKSNQKLRLYKFRNKLIHRQRNIVSQRKRMAREKYRLAHNKRCLNNHRHKSGQVANKSINKFLRSLKEGPSNECVSCGRLWFKKSLVYYSLRQLLAKNISKEFIFKACPGFKDHIDVGYLCSTCKKHILRQNIPPLSLYHSELKFPHISNTLKSMTALEERFVAPRIPFMRIQTLNHAGQFSIHGKVVNVPIDVPSSVKILPRLPHETDVVPIALKKKRVYKSNYLFESVRPNVVLNAVNELKNCDVYKAAGIIVDLNRMDKILEAHNNAVNDLNAQAEGDIERECNDAGEEIEVNGCDFEPLTVPSEETLLQQNVIVFAPGENKKPLPLLQDEHAESMSFVKIYGGTIRKIPERVTYQDLVKSEITRKDRRCCDLPKLFYSASKIRYQMVTSKIAFCLRQTKSKPQYTAGQLLDENEVRKIEVHDSGYKVFASDRGSPSFWESKKKEVFAMLRQLGPPTLFLTLSAAETRWSELLVMLKRILDGIEISEDEALQLPFKEKCRLIQNDPVTCSRYFDYKVRQFFSLMKRTNVVFEKENAIIDYYIRTEFQQRGSPHVHCLLWLNNAPHFDPDLKNEMECCKFVDKYITCFRGSADEETLGYQTHRHTASCKKVTKSGVACRFNFPLYPMRKTTILNPLDDDIDEKEKLELKENAKKLNSLIQELVKDGLDLTYDQFLDKLNMSDDVYIRTVRFRIKRTMVCLKRDPSEIMINQYNSNILQLYRANMDIQFITDKYSLVTYVLNYINKSSRGISKAMADAMDEIKDGNFTIRDKLKHLANKFLNASEFSAQEAIYFILSMPLSTCSRSSVFINTNRPEKRVSVVKSKKALMEMDSESTDVTAKNLLDYYVNRPDQLENACLADFAANYNYSKTERVSLNCKRNGNHDEFNRLEGECDYEEDGNNSNVYCKSFKLKNCLGYVRERLKSKIIRYVNFKKVQNETEYYREQAMLFYPWRDERNELLQADVQGLNNTKSDMINANRSKYVFSDAYDTAQLNNIVQEILGNEVYDGQQEEVLKSVNNEFALLDDRTEEGDIEFIDNGNGKKQTEPFEVFPVPYLIPEDEYSEKMRSLNEKQRKYLMHVLHVIKKDVSGLHECVLGGAGVGKSMLIECLQQTIIRYYNSIPGNTISDVRVLLSAPTGKAAYGIKGTTLHSAFVLPLNQMSGEMVPLSNSTCNTLLACMKNLKLIIIDEISMVGSRMLAQIDARLRQIFKQDIPFGNQNILLFGDFNQLPPVGDKFIFQTVADNPYSTLIGNPLWILFKGYLLTDIMRQKEDARFAAALNRLAEGKMNCDDIKLFKTRERQEICSQHSDDPIHLFRSNVEVDSFNNSVILKKGLEVCENSAEDSIFGEHSTKFKESVVKCIKNLKTQDTYGLPYKLKLSLDIRYMLTNNVNVKDGLVNGAVGKLKSIEMAEGKIVRLWIHFDDPSVGRQTRNVTLNSTTNLNTDWTPIEKMKRVIQLRKYKKVSFVREQFPLVPAEALTIYKSQGSTYRLVHVHLSKGLKRNELYVACSRATNIQGLIFDGNFNAPSPPSCHDPVPYHVKELLLIRPVNFSVTFLQDIKSAELSFFFHNIQSLNKHISDVIVDRCATSADLLIFVETWTKPSDKTEIPTHTIFKNICSEGDRRKPHGIVIYRKKGLTHDCLLVFQHSTDIDSERCNMVSFICSYYCFCILYKPPSTKFVNILPQFKTMLELAVKTNKKIIVLGDFNIDHISQRSHSCFQLLEDFSLRLKVQQNCKSNNGSTQIDLCFTNFVEIRVDYYESYFSYHKPIIGIIQKEGDNYEGEKNRLFECNVSQPNNKFEMRDVHGNISTKKLPPVAKTKKKCDNIPKRNIDYTANISNGAVRLNEFPVGFKNDDKVSCYCNAVCQSLFIHNAILDYFLNEELESPIHSLAVEFASNMSSPIDSKPIRTYIDYVLGQNVYTRCKQQDVGEFLTHFIEICQKVHELVVHNYSISRICTNCQFENSSFIQNRIVGLEITDNNNPTTMNELLDNQFNTWKSIGNSFCVECGHNCEKQEKITINNPNEVIIFQLGLWKVVNDRVKKRTVRIKNATNVDLTVGGIRYKLMAAIFHHGENVNRGHYTAMLKSNVGNNWIKADDETISSSVWPRFSKDAYVFMYRRI